jgi:peptidoglycan/xylan/chitin deacetylase (PgdA/CDA1 family)
MPASSVVNVCFHGIGTPQRELEPGEAPYWVSETAFRQILDELTEWPDVQISFDDGNASDVEIGLPALVERGLTAQFFLLAGRLDQPGSVSSEGVRALRKHGMAIGSHGMRHRSWRDLTPPEQVEEFVTARDQLAEVAQAPVTLAACPLGRYDRRVLAALRQHGYRTVYTSDRRPARAGSWLQPRYSVREDHTAESLRTDLRTAPQLAKRARQTAVGVIKRWR